VILNSKTICYFLKMLAPNSKSGFEKTRMGLRLAELPMFGVRDAVAARFRWFCRTRQAWLINFGRNRDSVRLKNCQNIVVFVIRETTFPNVKQGDTSTLFMWELLSYI